MAGIHEIIRETPKPKRPVPLPGEMLARLRRQVARFEEFVSVNRQLTALVEARLQELADPAASAEPLTQRRI
jgi:hypothetical protein